MDPGLANACITVFYESRGKGISIKKSFIIPKSDVIYNLTDKGSKGTKKKKYKDAKEPMQILLIKFSKIIDKILKKDISIFTAERYMVRGRFGQAQAECISFMLGIIAEKCRKKKIPFKVISAATWKNKVNKHQKDYLETIYKWCKDKYKMPPHHIDSFLQGCYGAEIPYNRVCKKSMFDLLAFVAGYKK